MKILNFLNKPFIKGLIRSIPIVGEMADNVLEETTHSPGGNLDKNKLVYQIVRLAALIGVMYFVFKGTMTEEDAEFFKDFIK